MDKIIPFLSEWTFHYIKNRDIVLKKIEKIEEYINKSYIFVKFKDKNQVFFLEPEISDIKKTLANIDSIKKESNSNYSCLIILNSLNNLEIVQNNWETISKDPKFSIIFVNPFSMLEKKWIVVPYTHSMITEPESLKQGLKSLFDTVEEISLETIKSKINQ